MRWWKFRAWLHNGPEPLTVGDIPNFQKGMMSQQVAVEKLVVDAREHRSYHKAVAGDYAVENVRAHPSRKRFSTTRLRPTKTHWPELH